MILNKIIGSILGFITLYILITIYPMPENPYYEHDELKAISIFIKYDLRNCTYPIEKNICNVNYSVSRAFSELCSISGNCNAHDAMHFWFSYNPEVNKTKKLWNELLLKD